MSIKDIAKKAGVSASTVSRVINSGDFSAASQKTREKIWNIAREQGYIPNQNARSLRRPQKSSKTVCRVDCIFTRVLGTKTDSFFDGLFHVVRAELLKNNYLLGSIFSLLDDPHFSAFSTASDAAIILGRISEAQILMLKKYYRNIINISLQNRDLSVDQVISPGSEAVVSAIHYLNSLGHTQISYLGETVDEDRYLAYLHTMEEIGVPDPCQLVVNAAFSAASGYDAATELLSRAKPFTAILCANDALALGVYKALNEHHLRVPKDISIVGINDSEEVHYLDPMLTAVNIPVEEMGKHAVKLLVDSIHGQHKLPVKMVLHNRLIARESCAKLSSY